MADTGAHTSTLPNHRYYQGCSGAWRTVVSMSVVDGVALSRSGMGTFDRWSVRFVASWPRFLGAFWLETTVSYDGSDEVVHTTVVRWLGIPMQRSVETIVLDPDGRRFVVRGGMSGSGSIDESGTRATYQLTWLGVPLTQTTTREPDLVVVSQQGPGFTGVQRLERRAG